MTRWLAAASEPLQAMVILACNQLLAFWIKIDGDSHGPASSSGFRARPGVPRHHVQNLPAARSVRPRALARRACDALLRAIFHGMNPTATIARPARTERERDQAPRLHTRRIKESHPIDAAFPRNSLSNQ
jgi:hypothetical protein